MNTVMSSEKQKKSSSVAEGNSPQVQSQSEIQQSRSQAGFKKISPAEFTPPGIKTGGTGRRRSPAWIAVIALLCIGIGLLAYLRMSAAVLINSEPADVEIDISGFAPVIANSYLLLPGEYHLNASATGYYDQQIDLSVESADSQNLDIVMLPLPGHIDISANVSDLTVDINGELSETLLPGVLRNIPQGDYQLTFSSYRYFPQTLDFSVDGYDAVQSLNVTMMPAWGMLEISSSPESAEIAIDGQTMGLTPLVVEVLETGSELVISKKGFKTWSETVSVGAGETGTHTEIKLLPADGTLVINSKPKGANLTLDGTFIGQTPLTIALTPGQSHKLKLFSQGYAILNKTVLLQPEERVSHLWTLKPELGEIKLRVKPPQAMVYVNGILQGSGDQSLNLLTTEQTLEVRLDGYVSQVQKIIPRTGLTQSIAVTLLDEQQHYWAQFPPRAIGPSGIELKLMRPQANFAMGTARREAGRRSNEAQRNVQIDKPFYIGKYEVTNNQYQQFLREHNSLQLAANSLNHGRQPVVNVSWLAAAKFCNWLSQQAQLDAVYDIANGRLLRSNLAANGYRLPTEAEWAWIARVDADNKLRRYVWGSSYPPRAVAANYADKSAQSLLAKSVPRYNDNYIVSAPVGSFPADAKGLHDIAGNVSEWIHDFYSIAPNRGDPLLNPSGPVSGRDHVFRGASWRHGSRTEIRLSYRNFGNEAELDLGFRVARNIE